MDTAERDRVRIGRGRLAREPERVADEVRDILNLGNLVVVGEDHGAPRSAASARISSCMVADLHTTRAASTPVRRRGNVRSG